MKVIHSHTFSGCDIKVLNSIKCILGFQVIWLFFFAITKSSKYESIRFTLIYPFLPNRYSIKDYETPYMLHWEILSSERIFYIFLQISGFVVLQSLKAR